MNKWKCGLGVVLMMFSVAVQASLIVPMYLTSDNGKGEKIGTITVDDTIYGLMLTPKLRDLPSGVHGFHVHAMPMCDHDGMGAGGHLDPDKTQAHKGPYSNGHLGDLPLLSVDENGKASLQVLAPRLHLSQIQGKALMVHEGGDNYSDKPEKLGGGGARIACGLIPYH